MELKVEVLRLAQDTRGMVFEPLRPEELPGQRNVHVVFTQPGGVRANHYHERGTEILTVCGPALLRVRAGDTLRDFVVPEQEVHRFTIPPHVAHAILNTGRQPSLTVSFTHGALRSAAPRRRARGVDPASGVKAL